jgi:hypothetical protein
MSKKLPCYSSITTYDSRVPINPIMDPTWLVDVPYVFCHSGKVPPVINEIPDTKLKAVKYNSNGYERVLDYGRK